MNLIDQDYVLIEGAAWVEVQGFAVRIRATPAGLVLDVYQSGQEASGPIDSFYVEPLDATSDL